MSAASMLKDACTISRPTFAKDATYGNVSQTFSNVATGVACNVQTRSRGETDEYGKTTARTFYRVFFRPDADVKPYDNVVITSGQFSGKTLRARTYAGDMSGHGAYLAVDGEEVEIA